MTNVFDVNAGELINSVSKTLMSIESLKAPEWSLFVKTGSHAERPPQNPNWWYVRLAAILRSLYVRGRPVGVQRLRNKFGGRKKHGYRPKTHVKAGGKIIRVALQQLEAEGLVRKEGKGRVLTSKGVSLLDKHAAGLVK